MTAMASSIKPENGFAVLAMKAGGAILLLTGVGAMAWWWCMPAISCAIALPLLHRKMVAMTTELATTAAAAIWLWARNGRAAIANIVGIETSLIVVNGDVDARPGVPR